MRLTAKGFQSWKSFDLEPDKFTAIIGPGNLGKSAIHRAFKALMRNQFSDNHINTGSDSMEVSATVDGHVITAKRSRKSSTTYTINGEPYSKIGKNIPDPVVQLGFNKVVFGDITLDPIFASQFDSQFLLNETPLALNTILGAFSSTEKLEAGKRKANASVGEINTRAKVLGTRSLAVEQRKEVLSGLMAEADALQTQIDELERSTKHQEAVIDAIQALCSNLTTYKLAKDAIDSLMIPDINPHIQKLKTVEAIAAAKTHITRHHALTDLAGRLNVPEVEPLLRAHQVVTHAGNIRVAAITTEAIKGVTGPIETVIRSWKALVKVYNQSASYLNLLDAYKGLDELKAVLSHPALAIADTFDVQLSALFTLRERAILASRIRTSIGLVADKKNALAKLESELEAATTLHQQLDQEYRISLCPQCGLNIKGEEHGH